MIFGRDAQACPAFRDAREKMACEAKSAMDFQTFHIRYVLEDNEYRTGRLHPWLIIMQDRRRRYFEDWRRLRQ